MSDKSRFVWKLICVAFDFLLCVIVTFFIEVYMWYEYGNIDYCVCVFIFMTLENVYVFKDTVKELMQSYNICRSNYIRFKISENCSILVEFNIRLINAISSIRG